MVRLTPHGKILLIALALTGCVQAGLGQSQAGNAPLKTADIMPVQPQCEGDDMAEAVYCTKASVARFVREHLERPLLAGDGWSSAISRIYFEVNEQGKVQNVRVVVKGDEQLDAAAVAAVEQLPDFIPGSHNGQPCVVKYTIPVRSEARCIRKVKR